MADRFSGGGRVGGGAAAGAAESPGACSGSGSPGAMIAVLGRWERAAGPGSAIAQSQCLVAPVYVSDERCYIWTLMGLKLSGINDIACSGTGTSCGAVT